MLDKKKIISSLIGAGIISAHVVGGSFAASCMGEFSKTFENQIHKSTVLPFVLNDEQDRVTGATLKALYPNASIVYESNLIADDTVLKTGSELKINGQDYTVVIYGDVNGDGKISISDATAILRHAKTLDILTGAKFVAADTNHSNSVTISDATKILRVCKTVDSYPTITTPLEPEVVETKLGEIFVDTNDSNKIKIEMEFDVDPSNFRYTLTGADNTEVAVTPTVGEDNKVTLTMAAGTLTNGSNYTLKVTDKNGAEVEESTFTYRTLQPITTVTIEGAVGINANNEKAITLTAAASAADIDVDKTVVVTLTDTEGEKVELTGKIVKGLVDTKVTGDVSSLKDGQLTVTSKVYDEEGNTVKASHTAITKAATPSTINVTDTTRISDTDAKVDFTTSAAKVYYKVVKEGEVAPSVEDVVKEAEVIGSTGTFTVQTLATGNMYNAYIVTENAMGTKSEVIVAPIAKDGITETLQKVTEIKSNGNGTFSWTDNQEKVTGYKVQLMQKIGSNAATCIAEKTVQGKTVDFSENIKEANQVASYTVNVMAIGDYKTINNSALQPGNINNAEQTLTVTALTNPTINAVQSLSDSQLRLDITNVDSKASGIKIQIVKGEINKDNGNAFEYLEENAVYTKTESIRDRWYDIDVSNFKDGAYQVWVTAIKGDSDISLLDSNTVKETNPYTRVMNGVKSYVINAQDVTVDEATLTIAPFKLDNFVATYKVKAVKANEDGTFADYTAPASPVSFTPLANTSLETYQLTGLDANSNYRVYLETIPKFDTSTEPTVKGNFLTYVDIQTKAIAFTTSGADWTVKVFANDAEENLTLATQIAVSKDGTKLLKYDAVEGKTVEVAGSNIEAVKNIVSKLNDGDKINIATDLKTSVTIVAPANTRTVALGDSIKDCDLTIKGNTGANPQLITVSGNVGTGKVILENAGKFNVQGLTVSSKVVTAKTTGQEIYVANGTTVELNTATKVTVNNVEVNTNVVVTDTDTMTISVEGLTSNVTVDTALDKTIVFTGTQKDNGSVTIKSTNGNKNTITVKTATESRIAPVTIDAPNSIVNLKDAYVASTTLTHGAVETNKVVTFGNIVITPNDSVVTVAEANGKMTVTGKATIAYTGSVTSVGVIGATETETVVEEPIAFDGKTFELSANGTATYTLSDNAQTKGVLTITLESGTITQK